MNYKKIKMGALNGMAQLVGHRTANTKSPVRFLVRAHAWDAGLVPWWGACKRQLINVCLSLLSPSLPLSLKINKVKKKKDVRMSTSKNKYLLPCLPTHQTRGENSLLSHQSRLPTRSTA